MNDFNEAAKEEFQPTQETKAPETASEAQEAQEAQEIVETPEVPEGGQLETGQSNDAPEEEKNPFLEYMRNAFSKSHIDEFMNTLTDDQKSFVYVFCSGFETAIGRHIVGVYDTSYIEGFHFTKDVLDSLRIVIKPVDVKDSDLKFTIVAQLV